ncbi:MAG: tetratricopeptide repeat protein [Planctomycetes bacterium]|nr:tetratricopeptide repeat protein [Planctomycetota bacterium]
MAAEFIGAEDSYLFRHALMRDVAYELQLPRDRAELHMLVIAAFEDTHGDRPPLPVLDPRSTGAWHRHSLDPFAAELAAHAELALLAGGTPHQRDVCRLYLHRAAGHALDGFQNVAAETLWAKLADYYDGWKKLECMRLAAAPLADTSRHAAAIERLEVALALARESGDRMSEGSLLADIGSAVGSLGRREESISQLEQALGIARAEDDIRTQAKVLANLAVRHVERGEYERGEELDLEAIKLFQEMGDKQREARVISNLTNVYSFSGRIEQAEKTCRKALALAREIADKRVMGLALSNLAGLLEHQGQFEHVEEYYREAADLEHDIGNPASESFTLGKLANHLMQIGALEKAASVLTRAEDSLQGRELPEMWYITRCRRGIYLAMTGDAAGARKAWDDGTAGLTRLQRTNYLRRAVTEMKERCSQAGVPPLE